MDGLLAALEATAVAEHMRTSRYTYPAVNALHIVGIAGLFGAIVPLDLRMLGLWRDRPLGELARVLRPVAASGFALAALTGALLFSAGAREYAGTPLFAVKLSLIALALGNALALSGRRLDAASPARLRAAGLASLVLWTAVIFAGRWLGYL